MSIRLVPMLSSTRKADSVLSPCALHELDQEYQSTILGFPPNETEGSTAIQDAESYGLCIQFTRAHGQAAGTITGFTRSGARLGD